MGGVLTHGLSSLTGAVLTDGLDGAPVVIDGEVYGVNYLPLAIANSPTLNLVPPWSALPSLNRLREGLILVCCDTQNNGIENRGYTIMSVGQESVAYNICYNLDRDVDVRPDYIVGERRYVLEYALTQFEAASVLVDSLAVSAFSEARQIGIPEPHMAYLEKYANDDVALVRLSALCSLITLVAIYLLQDHFRRDLAGG